MTPGQAADLLDAMVALLGALAVADEAKARLPGNCHPIEAHWQHLCGNLR